MPTIVIAQAKVKLWHLWKVHYFSACFPHKRAILDDWVQCQGGSDILPPNFVLFGCKMSVVLNGILCIRKEGLGRG